MINNFFLNIDRTGEIKNFCYEFHSDGTTKNISIGNK